MQGYLSYRYTRFGATTWIAWLQCNPRSLGEKRGSCAIPKSECHLTPAVLGTGRKSLTSWGWLLQFFIGCYYYCPLVAILLFSNQMSETRHGFCTAGLGTRGKGGYHLMAVLGYRLQVPQRVSVCCTLIQESHNLNWEATEHGIFVSGVFLMSNFA